MDPALADARASDLSLGLISSPTVREGRDFDGALLTSRIELDKSEPTVKMGRLSRSESPAFAALE